MNSAFVPGTFILPLVAEPEADIGALVLAVILFALPVALTMIAFALKAIPLGIAHTIGDHILAAEKRILGSLAHRVETAIRPFTLLVSTPVVLLDLLFSNQNAVFSETRAKLNDIKRGTIPHYFHSALAWTTQQLNDLHRYAQSLYGQNLNRIYHYYRLSRAHTDHYFQSAIDYATRIGHEAEHYAHVNDTILRNEIDHYYNLATQRSDAEFRQAMQRADTVKIAAETFATGSIATAVHYLEDLMSHRMHPLEQAEAATAKKLQTTIDECVQPLCDGLHDYAKELPKLLHLVNSAALLAFVEEMIREPERTAADTYDVAGPVLTGTMTLFRDLVGI